MRAQEALEKANEDLKLAKEAFEKANERAKRTKELLKEAEKEIISLLNGYPEILEQCYKNNELHPLCF